MELSKKTLLMLPWFVLASAAMVAIPGCEDNDGAEEVGEEIDEAAEEVEDALD
jgi:hypothetical protein